MSTIKQFAATALAIVAFTLLVPVTVLSAQGQTVASYMYDMGEALVPHGTIKGSNCHSVEIDLLGPWGDYAIPDGINKQKPDELTWAVIKVNARKIFLDLADLNEDKVDNNVIFSMEDASQHQDGEPYTPDTPIVSISTTGLNTEMTVWTVDLTKLKALQGQTHLTASQLDSELGITIEGRRGEFIVFSDKQHADAFQKAIQKAIVVCKAQ